jgi:hypothetical protein
LLTGQAGFDTVSGREQGEVKSGDIWGKECSRPTMVGIVTHARFSFYQVEADRTIQYGSGGSNQVTTVIDWETRCGMESSRSWNVGISI